MPFGRWGTVTEAGAHLGVTRQRVHQLMRKGALGETRLIDGPRGKVWLIHYPFERAVLTGVRGKNKKKRKDGVVWKLQHTIE